MERVLTTGSEAETRRVAAAFAAILDSDDVVTLAGEVGAGKTVFVRAVCEALEVPREAGVSSPTYALVNLYEGGRIPLAHLDLYRLGDEDELEGLGFRDLLADARAILIEWPERAPSLGELASVGIRIEDLGPERRRIAIAGLEPERLRRLDDQLRRLPAAS